MGYQAGVRFIAPCIKGRNGASLLMLMLYFLSEEDLMAKTIRNTSEALRLPCDDASDSFIARYTNEGEPYREGISIGVENKDFEKDVIVMLGESESKKLRDFLIKLYPV